MCVRAGGVREHALRALLDEGKWEREETRGKECSWGEDQR